MPSVSIHHRTASEATKERTHQTGDQALDRILHKWDAQLQRHLENKGEPPHLGMFIFSLSNLLDDPKRYKEKCKKAEKMLKQVLATDAYKPVFSGKPTSLIAEGDRQTIIETARVLHETGSLSTLLRSEMLTGVWNIVHIPLRTFRPKRNKEMFVDHNVFPAPDGNGGFYNNKFLQAEIHRRFSINARAVVEFFNKFPFFSGQLLVVPEPEKNHPQLLTKDLFSLMWDHAKATRKENPNSIFAYNACGAGASVNHFHYHTGETRKPYPVTLPQWKHNGGDQDYPLDCLVIRNKEDAWKMIEATHYASMYLANGTTKQSSFTYNFMIYRGQMYFYPRQFDNGSGIAWFEASGNRLNGEAMPEERILREYADIRLTEEQRNTLFLVHQQITATQAVA
ncbi:MAG: hypothetical protein WCP97_02365 [bacterium]